MRITVECYGMLRQLAGGERITLDMAGSTVAEALEALCHRTPALAAHLPRIACAVDDDIVRRADPLREGDILSLFPPVSGGMA